MIGRILVAAAIATLLPLATRVRAQGGSDIVSSDYCIRYFGSIRASVDVADAVPEYSLHNEFRCPRTWNFPSTRGAILELCPPYLLSRPAFKGQAMMASLKFGDTYLDRPIDGLSFSNMYITNGSVPGPFANDGQPAVIVQDPGASGAARFGAWFINGTETAFVEAPDGDDRTWVVYLNCYDFNSTDRFCSYEYASSGVTGPISGCWVEQAFYFNMETPLNFSIWFDYWDATVDIWSESEYIANYAGTGSTSKLTLHFRGNRPLPTVTDDEFWDNSPLTYEAVVATMHQTMEFRRDDQGFPLFWNRTNENWYSTRNGTYRLDNHTTRLEPERRNLTWSVLLIAVFLLSGMHEAL